MSRDLVQEPLVDVLLGLDSGKANVDLLIDCRYGSSRLRIRRGRIVDASAGEARGVPALDMLLALDEGRFELVENEQEAAGALDVSVGEALFGQVREPGKLDSAHPVAAAVTRHAQTTPGLIHSTRRRVLEQKTLLGLAPTRESSAEPRQKSDPPAALPLVRTIPPARFAGPRATRPLGTGYSSAPPPAYAEERVALPTTMTTRSSSSAPPPVSDGAASLGSTLAKASQAGDVAAPLGALSSARGVQDFGTSSARSEVSGSAQGTSQGAVQMPPIQPIEAETQHETGPVPSSQLDQSTLDRLEALHEGLSGTSHAIPAPPKSAETWPAPESPKPEANSSQLPRVGRYEVLARLKSGGMGSIYLCRLSGGAGFRRLFAMKVLHQNLAQQEEVLSLFFREANLLAQLHHPNVVGIVDVGSVQQPYLVLDYVEGGSLHELLRASSETRHPGAIVSIILDALNGLAAAH
ncbi:MAG TPA: protein kinase, partial [Polyangiaceae bacterium]|nr:protein kinase [Polyangiaceae bacterium]